MAPVFPETVLQTGALVLRPFSWADIADTRSAVTDPLTERWLPLPRPYTIDHAADWCTTASHRLREEGDGIHLAIADPGTDRLLGNVFSLTPADL